MLPPTYRIRESNFPLHTRPPSSQPEIPVSKQHLVPCWAGCSSRFQAIHTPVGQGKPQKYHGLCRESRFALDSLRCIPEMLCLRPNPWARSPPHVSRQSRRRCLSYRIVPLSLCSRAPYELLRNMLPRTEGLAMNHSNPLSGVCGPRAASRMAGQGGGELL